MIATLILVVLIIAALVIACRPMPDSRTARHKASSSSALRRSSRSLGAETSLSLPTASDGQSRAGQSRAGQSRAGRSSAADKASRP